MERLAFGEELTVSNTSDLIRDALRIYCEEAESINAMIEESNAKIADRIALDESDPFHLSEEEASQQAHKLCVA